MFLQGFVNRVIVLGALVATSAGVLACDKHSGASQPESAVTVPAAENTAVDAVKPQQEAQKTDPVAKPESQEQEVGSVVKPEPAAERAVNPGLVELIELVVTNKIESREPGEAVETFTADAGKAYAFARLAVKKPTQVTFIWRRSGHVHARITLNVQAAQKWRTYSSIQCRPGQWTVELLSGNEKLGERAFTVQ